MGAVPSQLRQLNAEVKDTEVKLDEVEEDLYKNPENTILLDRRNWLVKDLADLNARRKNLEDKLPPGAAVAGADPQTLEAGAGGDTVRPGDWAVMQLTLALQHLYMLLHPVNPPMETQQHHDSSVATCTPANLQGDSVPPLLRRRFINT